MQESLSQLFERPFPIAAIDAVRFNSWVFDKDYNIGRLFNTINPLIRGYTQMQASFASCMRDFSDMMRVLLSIKKMAEEGKLKHENLLMKVEKVSQVMFQDETILKVQTKLREVGTSFKQLMSPLEEVVDCEAVEREASQQHRSR